MSITPDEQSDVDVAAGVALHTRRWHGGGATPFVLVHGLASNARLWDGVAAHLADLGHPVIALDQRGHGRSSKPDVDAERLGEDDHVNPYDMATVTADLAALVEASGFDRPVVAGQSWGGNVVIELAARHPGLTRGVVAVDGGTIELASRFPDWNACAEALAPPPLAGTPQTELEAMIRRMHPDWPESGIAGTLACFEVRDDGTVAPWLTLARHLAVLRGLWEHHPAERYDAIVDPVLFLVADDPAADAGWKQDKVDGLARAEAALADATVAWMVGHHDLHAEHPVDVADRLVGFARRAT